jgi:phosphomannomutase/phosphoglucomutase
MFKFKKKKESGENPQGISSSGNALHRYWLISLFAILIPVLAGFGYLLLVREAEVQGSTVQKASHSFAEQQAGNIEQLFVSVKGRLRAAAESPLALAAIASRNPEDIALVERALMDYFPGASSIRLITIGSLGTAGLEGSNLGLRNHIEVDLLRRTSDDAGTSPEAYKFEGAWLTSLAELIRHPRASSNNAIILATFNNQFISDSLAALGADRGRSSLQQIYRNGGFNRADEIAYFGNGAATQYESSVPLNGSQWTLVFTPSAQMMSEFQIDSTPVAVLLGVILLVVLAALLTLLFLYERSLDATVAQITAAADKKTELKLGIPQLLPVARQLRRATLRHTSKLRSKMTKSGTAGKGNRSQEDTGSLDDEDEIEAQPKAKAKRSSESQSTGDLPAHIFRAYDIRGLVPEELDEDLVIRIGRAIGTLAGESGQQALIVGCDGRLSSPAIKNQLVKALLDSGRDVIDIGTVPTPLLSYATHTLSTKSGVMVTGSHNPAEYNGLKITIDGRPLAGEEMVQLRDRVVQGKFSEGAGRLAKQNVTADYIETVVGDMAIASPLKIVLDAGNGVAGAVAPLLIAELGCDVIPMYCDVDGSFPNHHPDPSVEANLEDLQARVLEEEADIGIAYDGDGDRLAVVGPDGKIVRTDKLLMLFAQDVVSRNPGADVVFDIKCSRHLAQLVSRYGGRPILWKTGHAFMRQKIMETGALLGGEFSGHIFFGERWFGFDDGIYASARLAEILSSVDGDLYSLLGDFPDTENTPEIRIPLSDERKFEVMTRLERDGDFSPGKINNMDGVRVDYNDGWGLLRASNTMPALVARFEAHDTDSLERIMQQFRQQLAAVEPDLDPGF